MARDSFILYTEQKAVVDKNVTSVNNHKVKLNEAEMLFSTIYFTKANTLSAKTYWGNYGHQYVAFWKGEDR